VVGLGPSRVGEAPWPELATQGGGEKEGGRGGRARVSPELHSCRVLGFRQSSSHRALGFCRSSTATRRGRIEGAAGHGRSRGLMEARRKKGAGVGGKEKEGGPQSAIRGGRRLCACLTHSWPRAVPVAFYFSSQPNFPSNENITAASMRSFVTPE